MGVDPRVGGLALFDVTVPGVSGDTGDNLISWDANFGAVVAVLSGTWYLWMQFCSAIFTPVCSAVFSVFENKHIVNKQDDIALNLWSCILELRGSNPGRNTGYPGGEVLVSSTETPEKF